MKIVKRFLSLLILAAILHAAPANAQQILGNPIGLAQTTTTESSHVFKAAPGNLYNLAVTTSSAAGYVMLFNATTAPSNGAVNPIACYGVAANSSLFIPYGYPLPFGTGIVAVYSTTGCNTLTLSTTAFFAAQVR